MLEIILYTNFAFLLYQNYGNFARESNLLIVFFPTWLSTTCSHRIVAYPFTFVSLFSILFITFQAVNADSLLYAPISRTRFRQVSPQHNHSADFYAAT